MSKSDVASAWQRIPVKGVMASLLILSLTACSSLHGTPQAAPAAGTVPQEIQRDQTHGLYRLKSVSVWVRGAPSDGEAAIKAKAREAHADYYMILFNQEDDLTGEWHAYAILYNKSAPDTSSAQH